MGRRKIDFDSRDLEVIENLCKIHCTGREIAAAMGCSYDVLQDRIESKFNKPLNEYIKERHEAGHVSLRRAQFKYAEKGNAQLLIHLGRMYLEDQKEKGASNESVEEMLKEIASRMNV